MDKPTILYVDDEESNLQGFLSIYFTEYNVITAISGKEALDILERREVQIIITDQKMPGMSGVEFLNKVVENYPEPIRVILTGYSDIQVIVDAINGCGIYRYLTKPWDVQEMNMVIAQALETYGLRKNNRELVENLKKANDGLEQKVADRTQEVTKQKAEIELKNEKITSSINYAKRIQDAMLPKIGDFKQYVQDAFVLFKPRDIVSGDFYWFTEYYGKVIIAAVDCTGHGVPGAFMSMLGSQALTNIVNLKHIYEPDAILKELRNETRVLLQQDATENKDGMDVSICMIDPDRQILNFAGAKHPLVYIQEGQLKYIKGDIHPIGGIAKEGESDFQNHQIFIDEPTVFYLFSDGYQDQFGGPNDRKFMVKRLRELLLEIHEQPFEKQKEVLDQSLKSWMGKWEQIDDILVMGFNVDF